MFRKAIIAACAATTLAVSVSNAVASTATSKATLVPATYGLTAVACPTTLRCVATGTDQSPDHSNAKSVLLNTRTGKATVRGTLKGYTPSSSIACPTVSTCLTAFAKVGGGPMAVVRISVATGAMTIVGKVTPPAHEIGISSNSIACQGTVDCWITGTAGQYLLGIPYLAKLSATGKVLHVTTFSGLANVGAVTCENKTICFLATYNDVAVVTKVVLLVNGKLAKTGHVVADSIIQAGTCLRTAVCYVTGYQESSGVFELWRVNPKTGTPSKGIFSQPADAAYFGYPMACETLTVCVTAGDDYARAASMILSNGKAKPVVIYPALNGPFSSVACAGTTCYAAGSTAQSKTVTVGDFRRV